MSILGSIGSAFGFGGRSASQPTQMPQMPQQQSQPGASWMTSGTLGAMTGNQGMAPMQSLMQRSGMFGNGMPGTLGNVGYGGFQGGMPPGLFRQMSMWGQLPPGFRHPTNQGGPVQMGGSGFLNMQAPHLDPNTGIYSDGTQTDWSRANGQGGVPPSGDSRWANNDYWKQFQDPNASTQPPPGWTPPRWQT